MQRLLLVSFVALCASVQCLDVEIVGVKCDESLPITADFKLKDCAAGSRCTFGQEATVYGSLYYRGVEDSGIQENMGYVTAEVFSRTLYFDLLDYLPINLCDETMVADENNENACPGDGTQNFAVVYDLPSAGKEQTSWLVSGRNAVGNIQVFTRQNVPMKLGACLLNLKTFASRQSLLGTPSAAAGAGIGLTVAAVLALLMLYFFFCGKRRKENNMKAQDEEVSCFQQMEEEKSYWSGAGS